MDRFLRQFLAVAESGSLTAASKVLGIAQPSLTANMRKLELEFGAELMERSPQGIKLTPYGVTLYENARLMRRLYENTQKTIGEQRQRREHGISLASGYTWWSLFIRDMVFEYRQHHPNAPIRVNIGNQLRCMEQLLSGDISAFVAFEIEGLSSGIGTDFIPLSRVHDGFFVRPGHPLLDQPRRLSEIGVYPTTISAPPDSRYQRFFDPAGRRGQSEGLMNAPNYAFASNLMSACVDYVLNSDAVLQHTYLLAPEMEKWGLAQVVQAEPFREFPMGVYVLSESRDEPRTTELLDMIVTWGRRALPQVTQ